MFFVERREIFKASPIAWYGKFLPFLGANWMFLIHQIMQEWVQLQTHGCKDYFLSFWNWIDGMYIVPCLIFNVAVWNQKDDWVFYKNTFAMHASGTLLLMLVKMLGMLRLFDMTSFYLKLIANTIKGSKQFLGLWMLAVLGIGFLPYFLNLVRVKDDLDDFKFDYDTQEWQNDETGASYSNENFERLKESASYMTNVYGE